MNNINKYLDNKSGSKKEIIRLKSSETFLCFRCKAKKKSKLRAIWHTSQGEKLSLTDAMVISKMRGKND